MYIPKTRSPSRITTIPTMSIRRHVSFMCREWFVMVWYVTDNEKEVAVVNINMEKTMTSAPVTPEYLLVRYC